MTTAADALAALRARLEANFTAIPLRWPNEGTSGHDGGDDDDGAPAAFAYVEFRADPAEMASFGGGRGANRWRNSGRLLAHVMVPIGQGLTQAAAWAEQIAAVFRSHRDDTVSCFAAWVDPGGAADADGNYFGCTAVCEFFFDQIG